mmetsp:Transcript_34643/g.71506  ORF Transcript_34643/g.71506 Transcript_34643/m.71506 type:complete len:213 (+) Transcript_34643:741-1379(+)
MREPPSGSSRCDPTMWTPSNDSLGSIIDTVYPSDKSVGFHSPLSSSAASSASSSTTGTCLQPSASVVSGTDGTEGDEEEGGLAGRSAMRSWAEGQRKLRSEWRPRPSVERLAIGARGKRGSLGSADAIWCCVKRGERSEPISCCSCVGVNVKLSNVLPSPSEWVEKNSLRNAQNSARKRLRTSSIPCWKLQDDTTPISCSRLQRRGSNVGDP